MKNATHKIIPRSIYKNLNFRKEVLDMMYSGDHGERQDMWKICKNDIIFWVNSFVWTYDPRLDEKQVPFILYPFQEDVLLKLIEGIETGTDVFMLKSRDMGASWLCCLVFQWYFLFHDMCSFLLVSRKEDLVDKPDDPKSLMWKMDFVNSRQPSFLKPKISRTKLHIMNENTGTSIDGESTTGDVARGDRRTAILLDEFAAVEDGYRVLNSTADSTRCRIFNTTPRGTGNAAYDVWEKSERLIRIQLHWSLHPEKNKGMYIGDSKKLKLEILDKYYKFPHDYPYQYDNKKRSIWYDYECKRRQFKTAIAQELDMDFIGSGAQFFDSDFMAIIESKCVNQYNKVDILFDSNAPLSGDFIVAQTPKGKFDLWIFLPDGFPAAPYGRYCVACDISAGTGCSNSVLSIGNADTGEKIGEMADPHIKPQDFARLALVVCRYFHNAFLIWEGNGGSGRNFGDEILKNPFRNFYRRVREQSSAFETKVTDQPGFFTTKENKFSLLGDYRDALARGRFKNFSLQAIKECRQYVYSSDGNIEFAKMSMDDPSGAEHHHGDRVMADALLCRAMSLMTDGTFRVLEEEKNPSEAPLGSYMYRKMQSTRTEKEKSGW
jgi:hypothetical protein